MLGHGTYNDLTSAERRALRRNGPCTEEVWGDDWRTFHARFLNQPAFPGAVCSGFLIDATREYALIHTSGHCVDPRRGCADVSAVFGYRYEPPSGDAQAPAFGDVLTCQSVVAHREEDGLVDYAVLKMVPREQGAGFPDVGDVRGWLAAREHKPVALARFGEALSAKGQGPVYLFGHFRGLPMKTSQGRFAESLPHTLNFKHSADSGPGSSGGMIATDAPGPSRTWYRSMLVWGAQSNGPSEGQSIWRATHLRGFFGAISRTDTFCATEFLDLNEARVFRTTTPVATYAYHAALDVCLRGLGSDGLCRAQLEAFTSHCETHPHDLLCLDSDYEGYKARVGGRQSTTEGSERCANGYDFCTDNVLSRCVLRDHVWERRDTDCRQARCTRQRGTQSGLGDDNLRSEYGCQPLPPTTDPKPDPCASLEEDQTHVDVCVYSKHSGSRSRPRSAR